MTVDDLLEAMRKYFPDTFTEHFESVWVPVYFVALQKFEGARLKRAWDSLLTSWKYKKAPTPADMKELCEQTRGGAEWARAGGENFSDDELVARLATWRRAHRNSGIGERALREYEAEAERRGLDIPVEAAP